MKVALVYAGQGAQFVGMGKELYEGSEAARRIFDQAGEDIKKACFEGPEEVLNRTDMAQPCIYTMEVAAYAALTDGYQGDAQFVMAGFSLGEYAALTASGVLPFDKGLELVRLRGQWMQEASGGKGGMAAMLGKLDAVEQCCKEAAGDGMCIPVNYNCPGQTVVSYDDEAGKRLAELARGYRLKCIPLKVGGPFHSPKMQPVAEKIVDYLQHVELNAPSCPLYSNVTACPMEKEELVDLIRRQVMSPVLWEQTVRNMAEDGVETFVELGPGKVLRGLIKKTIPQAALYGAEDAQSLQAVREVL